MKLTATQASEIEDALERVVEDLSLILNQLMFINDDEASEVEVPLDDYDLQLIKEHTGIEI